MGVSIYVSSRVCGAAAIVGRGGGTIQGIISRCPGVGVKVVFEEEVLSVEEVCLLSPSRVAFITLACAVMFDASG